MKAEQKKRIIQHGENLKLFFNLNKSLDPLKLCKQLRRLEKQIYYYSLKSCNEGLNDSDEAEIKRLLNKVEQILNFRKQNIKVFINYDARGHALKIDDIYKDKFRELNFYVDWGGYGIIAPEIN